MSRNSQKSQITTTHAQNKGRSTQLNHYTQLQSASNTQNLTDFLN
jgi:hypothetical protein